MNAVLVLAAALWAAAGAGAQTLSARSLQIRPAPAVLAGSSLVSPIVAPAPPLPLSAAMSAPLPPGRPAPAAAPAPVPPASAAAPLPRPAAPVPAPAAGPRALERAQALRREPADWDGGAATVEEDAAVRLAAPWRTEAQLARLNAAPRAPGERFRFAVIGDAEPGRFWFSRALFNRDPAAFWKLLHRADRSGADFIVQLGDMVSRGLLRNFWNFLTRLSEAAPRTPYLTVIGNHDRHSPHGVSHDRVYRSLFGPTDYVFERGGWRFVVADTSAGRLTSDQLAWLDRVLDGKTPTVVFTHMPPAPLGEWTDYGRKGAGGFKQGAAEFMRLMSQRRVSRVYMGHVHGFGVLERGGVRYVLTGGGGSPLFPGPVKQRFHHALDVEAGPDGLVETVRPLLGAPFPMPGRR